MCGTFQSSLVALADHHDADGVVIRKMRSESCDQRFLLRQESGIPKHRNLGWHPLISETEELAVILSHRRVHPRRPAAHRANAQKDLFLVQRTGGDGRVQIAEVKDAFRRFDSGPTLPQTKQFTRLVLGSAVHNKAVQRAMFLLGERGCLQAPPGSTAEAAGPG